MADLSPDIWVITLNDLNMSVKRQMLAEQISLKSPNYILSTGNLVQIK